MQGQGEPHLCEPPVLRVIDGKGRPLEIHVDIMMDIDRDITRDDTHVDKMESIVLIYKSDEND